MALNEKYSYKDFTGQYLTHLPASDFNNSEIVGSCFHIGNEPFSDIFPSDITGVTFTICSLSNCVVPPGNTVYIKNTENMPIAPSPGVTYLIDAKKGFSHRQVENRNDMEMWLLDENRNPVEPKSKKRFQDLGLSIDPNDIPTDFMRKEIHVKAEWLRTKDLPEVTDWFYETPQIIDQRTKHVKEYVPLVIWNNTLYKTRWTQNFDVAPSETLGKSSTGIDSIILEGDKTIYTVEGKGKHYIKGKRRPCENRMLTVQKELDNQQADIDALKAWNPEIAERLGIK